MDSAYKRGKNEKQPEEISIMRGNESVRKEPALGKVGLSTE